MLATTSARAPRADSAAPPPAPDLNAPLPISPGRAAALLARIYLPPTPLFGAKRADRRLADAAEDDEMAEGEPERVRNAGGPPVLAEFAPSDRAAGLLAVATANSIMVLKRDFEAEARAEQPGSTAAKGKWKYALAKTYEAGARATCLRFSPETRWDERGGRVDAELIFAVGYASSDLIFYHNETSHAVSLLGGPVTALAISHAPERVEHPQVSGPCRVVAVCTDAGLLSIYLFPTSSSAPHLLARHRLPSPALSLSFHPQHRHILLCACGDGAKVLEWRSGSWAWSCAPFPGARCTDGEWGPEGTVVVAAEGKWGLLEVGRGLVGGGESFPEGGLLRYSRAGNALAISAFRPSPTDLRPGTSELVRLFNLDSRIPKPIPIPMPGSMARTLSWHHTEPVLATAAGDAVMLWRV